MAHNFDNATPTNDRKFMTSFELYTTKLRIKGCMNFSRDSGLVNFVPAIAILPGLAHLTISSSNGAPYRYRAGEDNYSEWRAACPLPSCPMTLAVPTKSQMNGQRQPANQIEGGGRGRDIWEHAKRFSLAALANGENGANDATAIILESSDLSTKLD